MATQLIEYTATDKQDQAPARSIIMRDGIAGNKDIAVKMASLVRDSTSTDKGLETFVKGKGSDHLFGKKGYNDNAPKGEILETIYNFIKDHVSYVPDIAGNVENIKTARQTLLDGYGDCDDHAVLAATILAILGLDPILVLAGFGSATNFSHIYTAVNIKGQRYSLDTTIPNGQFNDEVQTDFKLELKPFDYIPQLDGIGGLVFSVKDALRNIKRDATTALPAVLNTVPTGLGYPLAILLQTGVGLMDQSSQHKNSVNAIGSDINATLSDIIFHLMDGSLALDHAKILANEAGLRLGLADHADPNYGIVYDSIKKKIAFINNFETTAKEKQIEVKYLDGKLMMITGAIVIGTVAHFFIKKKRGN